jgi:hypothetical protein
MNTTSSEMANISHTVLYLHLETLQYSMLSAFMKKRVRIRRHHEYGMLHLQLNSIIFLLPTFMIEKANSNGTKQEEGLERHVTIQS